MNIVKKHEKYKFVFYVGTPKEQEKIYNIYKKVGYVGSFDVRGTKSESIAVQNHPRNVIFKYSDVNPQREYEDRLVINIKKILNNKTKTLAKQMLK